MRIDLHIHSTASDGSLSPSALVWAARAGGLDIIAIADHDTVAGIGEARAASQDRVHVIPALEFSTTHDCGEVHILGYFIDPAYSDLLAYTLDAVEKRRERVRGMLARLAPYGISVTLDEVVQLAEPGTRMLGRPHIARALVRRGFVQTVSEAFDRFLGDSAPAFLPTELISPRNAIELIHAAGGLAVWAHPRISTLEREIDRFVSWGLDGLECYRPNASASDIRFIEALSSRRGLMVTGGSDWHGAWQGKLGDFYVNGSDIEALLDAGGI